MNQTDSHNSNITLTMSNIRQLNRDYAWNKARHIGAHDNHLFWSLSFQWDSEKHALPQRTDQFQPLDVFDDYNNQRIACWQPINAIVLKCMTWVLTPLHFV